ncbi:MAG: DUF5615 family PIN-like protein, partial [Acidobacteriota bacterium]|nr:DUF5615 family PIN-like protein [Acidobacteriota bacterium]
MRDSSSIAQAAGTGPPRTSPQTRVKIKFLADEDLRRAIVLGVRRREPTVSFVHASDVGAAGLDDHAVLQIAAKAGRILVSHD